MRRRLKLVGVTLIAAIAVSSLSSAAPDSVADELKSIRMFASPPDSSVKDWMWYQILGNRNHPFPIVYVSTTHFETHPFEMLIVLSQSDYETVARATRSEMVSPSCVAGWPKHDLPTPWYTLEIAKHHRSQIQRCMIGRGDACAFLRKISTLPNVAWPAQEWQPIDLLVGDVCCTEVGDGWTAPAMCEKLRAENRRAQH